MYSETLKTPLYNQYYYDFLSAKQKIGDFLIHPQRTDWEHLFQSIEPDSPVHRTLKDVLRKQNSDLDSDRAQIHISGLKKKNSIIVITGQQLGLFASPMYTIYKALTTVQLSENLSRNHPGYSFIPVFWLESEDHDFEEVNHFGLWNKNFEPVTISYQGENRGKVSLRHYNFTSDVESMVSQIESGLQKTDFTPGIIEQIRRFCFEGKSWLSGTREFLKYYFESAGLLFFQPGASEVKEIAVDFFRLFLRESEAIRQQFSAVSSELIDLGYDNQVPDLPGKTYIHLENEHLQRMHLYVENKNFTLGESGKRMTWREMENFVIKNMDRISTAVVSRPVLQSWLLPVAAYVAGPAEIAYWAQLKGIFNYLNVQMPVIYPRISATLIEPKIERYIEKHSPDIANIINKSNLFIDAYFKRSLEQSVENPFKKVNSQISELMAEIKQYLTQLDTTLGNTVDKSGERIKQQIEQLEQKSVKVKQQQEELLISHLRKIHNAFFPHGKPQERFVSPIYFFNKFGPEFMTTLFKVLSFENWGHQIVSIDH